MRLMAKAAQSHGPYKKSDLIPVFLCALLSGCSGRGVHGGRGEEDKLRMLPMGCRSNEHAALLLGDTGAWLQFPVLPLSPAWNQQLLHFTYWRAHAPGPRFVMAAFRVAQKEW